MKLRPFLAVAIFSLAPLLGRAMFMRPESVPVEKLIATVNKIVEAEPKNAEAHFTLGRIHYLAFATTKANLDAYPARGERKLPSVGPFIRLSTANSGEIYDEAEKRTLSELKLKTKPDYGKPDYEKYAARMRQISEELEKSGWRSSGLPDAEGSGHLAKALAEYQKAMKLDPKKSLYQLGYASLMEQATEWAKQHPKAEVPSEIRTANRSNVLNEYRKAWQMELAADMKDKEERGMMSAMDMVSYEAGSAYVRLAKRDESALTVVEKTALAKIETSLKELYDRTSRAVTPLILSQRAIGSIDELLAPETSVTFPLRGWGPDGRWTWIKPDVALLVWNPSRSGKVASGAQLFGGYTWELFWKNGYEPLAVLDADGDSVLRGDELAGISVWFDKNSNGVSDPGEVQTLAEAGITALATRPTSTDGIHPMNARGVTFSDGRVLPTWDWIAAPAAPAGTPDQRP